MLAEVRLWVPEENGRVYTELEPEVSPDLGMQGEAGERPGRLGGREGGVLGSPQGHASCQKGFRHLEPAQNLITFLGGGSSLVILFYTHFLMY